MQKGRAVGIEGRQINTVIAKDGTTKAAPSKTAKRTTVAPSAVASTTNQDTVNEDAEETAVPVSADSEIKPTAEKKKKKKKESTYGQRVEFAGNSSSKTTRGTTKTGTTTKASSTTTKNTSTHSSSASVASDADYYSDSDEEIEKKGTVVILARVRLPSDSTLC